MIHPQKYELLGPPIDQFIFCAALLENSFWAHLFVIMGVGTFLDCGFGMWN